MFCKNCGAQLPDNVNFCNSCGTRVTAPTQVASAPPAAVPQAAAQPIHAQPQTTYTQPQAPAGLPAPNPQAPVYNYSNAMPQAPVAPKQENVALGLIGSLAGVLVGSAVFIVSGIVGMIVGFSGLIMVALGIFLYNKLSGAEHSIIGAIATAVMAAIAVFFAEWIVCGYILYDEKIVASFGDGLSKWFALVDQYPKLEEAYTHDLLLGYLFTIAGAATSIVREIQAARKK